MENCKSYYALYIIFGTKNLRFAGIYHRNIFCFFICCEYISSHICEDISHYWFHWYQLLVLRN